MKRWVMVRLVIFWLLASISVLVIGAEIGEKELEEYKKVQSMVKDVKRSAYQVIERIGEIRKLSGATLTGEVTQDYVLDKLWEHYALAQLRLRDFKQSLSQFYSLELDTLFAQTRYERYKKFFGDLDDKLIAWIEDSEEVITATASSDTSLLDQLWFFSIDRYVAFLKGEIITLEFDKTDVISFTDYYHPQRYYLTSVIATHRAFIYLAKTLKSIELQESENSTKEYLARIQLQLREANSATEEGRRVIPINADYWRYWAEREKKPEWNEHAKFISENYASTFDIESEIVSLLENMATRWQFIVNQGNYESSKENFHNGWRKFELKIKILTEERFRLQIERS